MDQDPVTKKDVINAETHLKLALEEVETHVRQALKEMETHLLEAFHRFTEANNRRVS